MSDQAAALAALREAAATYQRRIDAADEATVELREAIERCAAADVEVDDIQAALNSAGPGSWATLRGMCQVCGITFEAPSEAEVEEWFDAHTCTTPKLN